MHFLTFLMLSAIVLVTGASLFAFLAHAIAALRWRRKLASVPYDAPDRHCEDIEKRQIREQAYAALFLVVFVMMAVLLLAMVVSHRVATTELQVFVFIGVPVFAAARIGYVAVKYYDTRFCNSYLRCTYF
ncbi:MAG: hypothetical protein UY35_C0001G0117 [Candidatus Saccharibacteria bacterium GW2011_GWC2_48_9]|nr:MAG: hypothetical protein UY35_C0001G0117 [Candidatus Saccharibacteria bacterium GW2011_GWC2_48_9]